VQVLHSEDIASHTVPESCVAYREVRREALTGVRAGQPLKAGFMEDGVVTASEEGTPQGAVISPLLANIYLHYVFDLWANQWRKRHALGHMILIRYADDIVVGFDNAFDAKHFQTALHKRMEQFSLSLHPEKTRLLEFGRFAAADRSQRGASKPETFNFLGFTHICGQNPTW